MYNGDTGKWESVDIADQNSIVYLDSEGLSIKGYDSAGDGQMLVKNASTGIAWVNPVDDTSLQNAVTAANESATAASSAKLDAENSAISAHDSAVTAQRINDVTRRYVDDKFWWGTIEEYNRLETIKEGTFYHIIV